jgi:hypothetical protein
VDAGRDGKPERFGGDQAPDLRIRRSPLRVGPIQPHPREVVERSTRSPAAFAPAAETTRWRHGCSLRRHCPNDEPAACRWAIVRSRSSPRSVRGSVAMANASVTRTPTAAQAVVGVFLCPRTLSHQPTLLRPCAASLKCDSAARSASGGQPSSRGLAGAIGHVVESVAGRPTDGTRVAWHNVCVMQPRRTMRRRRISETGL